MQLNKKQKRAYKAFLRLKRDNISYNLHGWGCSDPNISPGKIVGIDLKGCNFLFFLDAPNSGWSRSHISELKPTYIIPNSKLGIIRFNENRLWNVTITDRTINEFLRQQQEYKLKTHNHEFLFNPFHLR